MDIGLISNNYMQYFPLVGYGGIESCVENLACGLYELGFHFFCALPKPDKGVFGMKNLPKYPFQIIEAPYIPSSRSISPAQEFGRLAAKNEG
jgi:hypothetical protein